MAGSFDCPADASGILDCSTEQNVPLTCQPNTGVFCTSDVVCVQGSVRLVGPERGAGRVEYCNNNEWGTVCGDEWDDEEATVICNQLNFTGTSIWWDTNCVCDCL